MSMLETTINWKEVTALDGCVEHPRNDKTITIAEIFELDTTPRAKLDILLCIDLLSIEQLRQFVCDCLMYTADKTHAGDCYNIRKTVDAIRNLQALKPDELEEIRRKASNSISAAHARGWKYMVFESMAILTIITDDRYKIAYSLMSIMQIRANSIEEENNNLAKYLEMLKEYLGSI